MDNFKKDERAKEVVDEFDGNAYNLARRIVELERRIGATGGVLSTSELNVELYSDKPTIES